MIFNKKLIISSLLMSFFMLQNDVCSAMMRRLSHLIEIRDVKKIAHRRAFSLFERRYCSSEKKPHSAEHFTPSRDFWWNEDFLDLMAKRWQLGRMSKVLDVGCGVGHWGFKISSYLKTGFSLYGVDSEEEWVDIATQRSTLFSKRGQFLFSKASAEKLPFPDRFFDMVTCQTLLIHVASPEDVLREMMRTLKPGGLVAVAEPNNLAGTLVMHSTHNNMPPEQILDLVKLQLYCEKGKVILGKGNSSVGDLLPGIFAKLGLSGINVYTSDKTSVIFPPYPTKEQQVLRKEINSLTSRTKLNNLRNQLEQDFFAYCSDKNEFERLWQNLVSTFKSITDDSERNELSGAGGALMYLISGTKNR